MSPHQRQFLELALAREALRFGAFTLKSGRVSPYFFNAGRFDSGAAMAGLGACYAAALAESGLAFDMVFGPAYKGIPLATATAVALAGAGRDVPLAFNRKEAKAHGEGGLLVGAPLAGRVVIIDDVITDGASKRESVDIIRAAGAQPVAVLIALDRMERSGTEGNLSINSAVEEFTRDQGLPVHSIASLSDLLQYLDSGADPALSMHRSAVVAYRQRYGV